MKNLRYFGLITLSFLLFLLICSFLFSPTIGEKPLELPREAVEQARELRAFDIGPEDRIRIQQEVDYSAGESAPWYPVGESPLLRDLVEAGHLPPVEERVGPEPVVMAGPDGVGNYGGSLYQTKSSIRAMATQFPYYSGAYLVRWSPLGEPIVPHIAKRFETLDGGREYRIHLRKGMRWSDGHPFTADDVLYWWHHEFNDESVNVGRSDLMDHRGKTGTIEKLDDYTLRFRFEEPNGLFLAKLGGPAGMLVAGSPEHYLRPYHPELGDQEVVELAMQAENAPTPRAMYSAIKSWDNPEHPRLWPFLYRSHKSSSPYTWVRNPYYYAVDTEGNQLPYVDRVVYSLKSRDLIAIAAANGELSFQQGLPFNDYTILMAQREKGGYELYHYSYGDGTAGGLFPNMTKRRDPSQPDAAKKEALFRTKEFRQALSLAINREAIIEVEYGGIVEPAQIGPGPTSPFHNPDQYYAYVDYDPARANALLDGIGLTRRDAEGYRTFRDGSSMVFHMSYPATGNFSAAMAQSIVEDWAAIGVRAVFKGKAASLYYHEREALLHDILVSAVNGQAYPLMQPRIYLPHMGSFYAQAWGYWFDRGGYYGKELDPASGAKPPPEGHPFWEAFRLYDEITQMTDREKQIEAFDEVLDIAAENTWTINIASPPPFLAVVKDGLNNVPRRGYWTWEFLTSGIMGLETYYWDNPSETQSAIDQMKESIIRPIGTPEGIARIDTGLDAERVIPGEKGIGFLQVVMGLVKVLFLIGIVILGIRFPFIGNRILLMIPTVVVISVVVFIIIQLPPGDYSTTLVAQAEAMGEESDLQRIEEVKELFLLDESWMERYLDWTGLRWFLTFEKADTGLLQGNLGRSMETMEPVSEVMGDRFLLTVCISVGTILFTWMLALPIGIYSAVKQYSAGDYIFTFVGFLGMCIPNFLLALLLMFFSSSVLGVNVSGLFSTEYAAQPGWTPGKVWDLLTHLWVPVVVLGTGGTASMIRIMRGNLLDELKKPYVTTARAKGVRPVKLILKYPVRLALNPFISGIGTLFPQIISGGAIVALILSLPTVGPLLLQALLTEDMYLAGSLLIILSILGVVGTLVSDLLLMILDPRIRMQGGRR